MHSLSRNSLGAEGAAALAPALAANGSLTELSINGNVVGDEGVRAICEAIQSNKETKLASLNFGYNGIGPVGANALAAMVAVTGSLTKLSLAKNKLKEEGTKAICEALEQNKTLKELDISGGFRRASNIGGNIGGPAGVKHVAKMLGVNGGLTALDLSSNNLDDVDDENVSAVCEAIQSNKETKLASLNFKNNNIGPVGANALAAMVAVTGSLTKMSLAENKLEEEGTKAICEALEQNKTLKELDISGGYPSGSNIGGLAGAKHVAKMLGVNSSLTSLDLSNNALCGMTIHGGTYTAEGITAIADALRVNGSLTSLSTSVTTSCAVSMNMGPELTLQMASQLLPTLCASMAG